MLWLLLLLLLVVPLQLMFFSCLWASYQVHIYRGSINNYNGIWNWRARVTSEMIWIWNLFCKVYIGNIKQMYTSLTPVSIKLRGCRFESHVDNIKWSGSFNMKQLRPIFGLYDISQLVQLQLLVLFLGLLQSLQLQTQCYLFQVWYGLKLMCLHTRRFNELPCRRMPSSHTCLARTNLGSASSGQMFVSTTQKTLLPYIFTLLNSLSPGLLDPSVSVRDSLVRCFSNVLILRTGNCFNSLTRCFSTSAYIKWHVILKITFDNIATVYHKHILLPLHVKTVYYVWTMGRVLLF